MKKFKFVLLIACALFDIALYLIFLPAINIQSLGFWYFLLFAVAPYFIIGCVRKDLPLIRSKKWSLLSIKNSSLSLKMLVILSIVVMLATIIGTPLLGGYQNYRNRIKISDASTFEQIEPFSADQVQIIDKSIATSLADRVFGEMGAEIVSQYEISDNYASIVYDKTMYRITPVEYAGLIKWISTAKNGTPGYIMVNVTSGDTKYVRADKGLRYMPHACFFNNLAIHLRISYPTYIFGNSKFEIDDNGKPYWVSQVISYSFIGKAKDIKGVVLTDPVTGDNQYYSVNEVPSWVDNVYDAVTVSKQYNDYGNLINGLFNFSQKGITAVTDDYAYLQKDGHLWMYTGVTSVGNDESNVGFIYVDLQDKEVIYIVSAGAEEYSARSSAEGEVQEKGYHAVFPTIVNVANKPTYFMGLKDDAGLVKAYAFVDYKNYSKVAVGSTINEAYKKFTNEEEEIIDIDEMKEIVVSDIASAVVNGNSVYYIKTNQNEYYEVSIDVSNKLPFVKPNDILKVGIHGKKIISIEE